ncbi:helix-turn-helix domain-containing protein [Amycolatopsis sp. CA-230715]|uniref:helix-turn-helix domain-containing protein n=1 Tax=Amycolatopsis sp. CA-230715 TaxID=2745196 RepID=UPI001C02A3F2|nr:helix-turn-helix domain-containing protein [Amycolatopsis sp. CA-230715]QWF81568.1 hypothetical protein HUW46_05001 [Amycolatopsis sp. CA-230715]
MSGSPPTSRVVSVVELLAARPDGCSVAEVTASLELNRATVTSVLAELERTGWARRRADRSYVLGPGLLGVTEAVRAALPLPRGAADRVAALADEVRCGASLSLVEPHRMTFVAVSESVSGRLPGGLAVGTRIPLLPPTGATVMAWRDAREQRAWLDDADEHEREGFREMLAALAGRAITVWRLDDSAADLLGVLADVVDALADHPTRHHLRRRALTELSRLVGNAYRTDELETDRPLPVSYLAAPVFAGGAATHELQIGPLHPALARGERERMALALMAAAGELSQP